MKKILIAIDDGPISEKVAAAGFSLGAELHAEIALVSVINVDSALSDGGVTPSELRTIIEKDLRQFQHQMIKEFAKDDSTQKFIEKGKPTEAILKVADEWGADLIVLGTHGRTGLPHALIGSVAEHIIRHSKKPVYVVPAKS